VHDICFSVPDVTVYPFTDHPDHISGSPVVSIIGERNIKLNNGHTVHTTNQ